MRADRPETDTQTELVCTAGDYTAVKAPSSNHIHSSRDVVCVLTPGEVIHSKCHLKSLHGYADPSKAEGA